MRPRFALLAAVGAAALGAAAVLLVTVDADCPASGSYGNYCALQQPHIWGFPLGAMGLGLVVGAIVSFARARNGG